MSAKWFGLAFVIALAGHNILQSRQGMKNTYKVDNASPRSLTRISEKNYDYIKTRASSTVEENSNARLEVPPFSMDAVEEKKQAAVGRPTAGRARKETLTTELVVEDDDDDDKDKRSPSTDQNGEDLSMVGTTNGSIAAKIDSNNGVFQVSERKSNDTTLMVTERGQTTIKEFDNGGPKQEWKKPLAPMPWMMAGIDIQSKVATPLPPERQSEPVLFVHVGKAGGQSLRVAIKQANRTCQTENSFGNLSKTILPATTKTPYHCSMARMVARDRKGTDKARIVHLWINNDAFPNFSQFLVTVRNPIDRLVSWFNYERIAVLAPRTRKKKKRKYPLATTLHTCFRTLNEVVGAVLLNQTTTTGGGVVMSPYFYNNSEACTVAGRQCLSGNETCGFHSHFNYEYYLENLVQWKTCHHHHHQQHQQQQIIPNNCTARDIRIDVLRADENPKADLERILELWTGVPRRNLTRSISYGHANSHSAVEARLKFEENRTSTESLTTTANTTIEDPTKYISPEGVLALCKAICPELLVYKSTLALAYNLNTSDVRKSYEDLDATCRTSVDALCGTEFRFRNIKKKAWAGQ